jgi:ribulose-phosphate 3-epimerase
MIQIAPSILSADFSRLGEQVRAAESGGAGMIHLDVMDGHFVPNLTIGPAVVGAVRACTDLPLDCHLMIEEPDRYLEVFAAAGADLISVHQEAAVHLQRTLQTIRSLGKRPGVVLNPATPVETLTEVIAEVDFVLVMSVNPGFGGQSFLPRTNAKISSLSRLIAAAGAEAVIQVDGGVDAGNAAELARRGAEWLVAGSAVFGAEDPAEAVRRLAEEARRGAEARTGGGGAA